eukprot:403353618
MQQYLSNFAQVSNAQTAHSNEIAQDYTQRKIIEITFLSAFSVVFILILISSVNTLRKSTNRTIQNIFTIVFMIMTLFVRIGVLIMALKETMDDPYDKYEVNDTEFFFYFEIPFNFIMTGLIVQFYSWYQFGVFIKHELDPQMALDYRVRYKLGLLVSIIVCFTGLIVQFSAVAIQRDSDPLLPDYISKEFKVDMDWIMITLYSVISFSFLPLFISIMLKIRKHYDTLYKRMRIKFTLLFTIFMIFILGRLFLYFDVKSLRLLYSSVTMYTVLPFYITEIVMALFLSYILFSVNQMDRLSKSDSNSFLMTPTQIHYRDESTNLSQIMLSNDNQQNHDSNHYLPNFKKLMPHQYSKSSHDISQLYNYQQSKSNQKSQEIQKRTLLAQDRQANRFQTIHQKQNNHVYQFESNSGYKNKKGTKSYILEADNVENKSMLSQEIQQFEPKTIEEDDDGFLNQRSSVYLYPNSSIYDNEHRDTHHYNNYHVDSDRNKNYYLDQPLSSPKSDFFHNNDDTNETTIPPSSNHQDFHFVSQEQPRQSKFMKMLANSKIGSIFKKNNTKAVYSQYNNTFDRNNNINDTVMMTTEGIDNQSEGNDSHINYRDDDKYS